MSNCSESAFYSFTYCNHQVMREKWVTNVKDEDNIEIRYLSFIILIQVCNMGVKSSYSVKGNKNYSYFKF